MRVYECNKLWTQPLILYLLLTGAVYFVLAKWCYTFFFIFYREHSISWKLTSVGTNDVQKSTKTTFGKFSWFFRGALFYYFVLHSNWVCAKNKNQLWLGVDKYCSSWWNSNKTDPSSSGQDVIMLSSFQSKSWGVYEHIENVWSLYGFKTWDV